MIRNLLANAMRFAPEGSVITIDCADHGTEASRCGCAITGPAFRPTS
ncbi:MAG: hypothetical protein IPM99_19350 [Rubrivivax sp.]|nr:hypothetical protein [Rubrivivax sp.]